MWCRGRGHGAGGFIAQLQRPGNQAVKITFSDAGPLHAWQHVLLWNANKAKERTGIPRLLFLIAILSIPSKWFYPVNILDRIAGRSLEVFSQLAGCPPGGGRRGGCIHNGH